MTNLPSISLWSALRALHWEARCSRAYPSWRYCAPNLTECTTPLLLLVQACVVSRLKLRIRQVLQVILVPRGLGFDGNDRFREGLPPCGRPGLPLRRFFLGLQSNLKPANLTKRLLGIHAVDLLGQIGIQGEVMKNLGAE